MPFTSISAGWIFTLMGLLDDGRPLNQGKSQQSRPPNAASSHMGAKYGAATSLRSCCVVLGDQDGWGTNRLSKAESILGTGMSQNLSRDRRHTCGNVDTTDQTPVLRGRRVCSVEKTSSRAPGERKTRELLLSASTLAREMGYRSILATSRRPKTPEPVDR